MSIFKLKQKGLKTRENTKMRAFTKYNQVLFRVWHFQNAPYPGCGKKGRELLKRVDTEKLGNNKKTQAYQLTSN